MTLMRAGKMDRRITLYRMVKTRKATGEIVDEPTQYMTTWAERRPVRGDERWVGQQVAAEAEEMFRIRWRANLSPVVELAYNGRRYSVISVMEVGRREGLDILARSRAETSATPT